MGQNVDPKKMLTVNGSVLVVDNAKEEVSTGGIVLPDNAEGDRMICGTVLSRSPFLLEDGRWMDPPFKTNDKVIYSMHGGAGNTWVDQLDTRTYRLLKWNEVLAVVDAQ